MICKLCGKKLKTPDQAMVIGIHPQQKVQIIMAALGQHLQEEANHEAQAYQRQTNGKPSPAQVLPKMLHTQAVQSCIVHGGAVQGYFTLQCFVLDSELEAIQEQNRRVIHEWSRSVRITDEELKELVESDVAEIDGLRNTPALSYLKDLRDRYEGLGKYAPQAPVQQPGPQLIKPA